MGTSTTINSPLPRCPICLSGAGHFQRIFLTSSPLPAVQRGGVVVSEQQREDGYSTPPAKTTSPTAALTAVTERTTKPEPVLMRIIARLKTTRRKPHVRHAIYPMVATSIEI